MLYGGILKRDELCDLLPDISTFMDSDCMYSVTDTEKFIAYVPGSSVDIKAKIGDPVPQQSPLMAAFQERRIVTKIVPQEVWGVAFRSTATPIFDEKGQVVGCVGIGISIEQESNLIQTYQQFTQLLASMTELNVEITTGMENVKKKSVDFVELMQKANQDIEQANGFIEQIDSLARTTDLLSVNAYVEAAHAGQEGAGFSIVATEIKTLSAKTKSLATDIGAILIRISESFDTLSTLSSENAEEIMTQLETLQKNQTVMNDMHSTASKYSKLLNMK